MLERILKISNELDSSLFLFGGRQTGKTTILHQQFPNALIFGHNEFDKSKSCPCFDAEEYRMVFARR